jgi:hypothetical protein
MKADSLGFTEMQQFLPKRLYLSTRRVILIFTAVVTQISQYACRL